MIHFSEAAQRMRSSEIRRLMKLAADPSVISFAGGMPNNDLFPVQALDEIYSGLSPKEKQQGFQYGPTSGYPPLLEALKEYLTGRGFSLEGNGLLITTGAQQALNLVTRVLVDPGDRIVTEDPCFIGAVAAFRAYGAQLRGVELESDGVELNSFARELENPNSRLAYLSPYFHNPAGIVYSDAKKNEVVSIIKRTGTVLLEDDPYGELYFDDEAAALVTPMKVIADAGIPICYVGSFSKIFGPGMRLGWLLAPTEIAEKCELAKQSSDACSSTMTQVLANAFLRQDRLRSYTEWLRQVYRKRAGLLLDALEKYMPEGVTWTRPRGGFYVWVTLPDGIDSSDVFQRSIAKGAAFVIGSAFDPQGVKNNSFRLAFSHTPEDRIQEGVKVIAEAVGG